MRRLLGFLLITTPICILVGFMTMPTILIPVMIFVWWCNQVIDAVHHATAKKVRNV